MLKEAGVVGSFELSTPPKSAMGDLAFPCFAIAKEQAKNPAEVAKMLAAQLQNSTSALVEKVQAFGPYVNFFLNGAEVAKLVIQAIADQGAQYGGSQMGKGKKIMVEFAHPNTHKAFHIGHLRNIITGESMVRIFENAGFVVTRVNYQGDVGMHIAKCLWGITQLFSEYKTVQSEDLAERVAFLGRAYATGGQAYEANETAQKEIGAINEQIYRGDDSIKELYTTTRQWSLEYFDHIYKRVDSRFDRLYFESEVFERGRVIVREFLAKGVFKESEGAVIFPGSEYELHDRVFLNKLGLPTYEAKELALAEKQFSEFAPDAIYHVVAKEQSEYFKVSFKALEFTLPESKGREHHLVYGWVRLKEGKMSSRTGQVILGEWLLDETEQKIAEIMAENGVSGRSETIQRVALAAVKYAMLHTSVANDIAFDVKAAANLTGDSGPYLLYMCTRIKSILAKAQVNTDNVGVPVELAPAEKALALALGNFPEVAAFAAESTNPSLIAHYLLELAHRFSEFYEACPVLSVEPELQSFRVALVRAVLQVAEKGLYLLGIKTVEEM